MNSILLLSLVTGSMLSGGSEKVWAEIRFCGRREDLDGGAELGHPSFMEGGGIAAQQQSLGRFGGGVDEDGAGGGKDLGKLFPQLFSEFVVEVGQRLVEQHQLGTLGQGPGQGGALLLAAGELLGCAVQHVAKFEQRGDFAHPPFDLGS